MIKIAVSGACGRMGQAILKMIYEDRETSICGGIDRKDHPLWGRDIGDALGIGQCGYSIVEHPSLLKETPNAIIDFSNPDFTMEIIRFGSDKKIPMVIGTTGFTKEQETHIADIARDIAILKSPNMSVGVNVFFKLIEEASLLLGLDYDVEIIEAHHRLKKDAPSGTAKYILNIIQLAREKLGAKSIPVYGREGQVGERRKEEISVLSVRAGDIVGDHTVIFGGSSERVELTHKAHTRENFAKGAVRAAKFLARQKPGLYSMKDALGL